MSQPIDNDVPTPTVFSTWYEACDCHYMRRVDALSKVVEECVRCGAEEYTLKVENAGSHRAPEELTGS